jgi:hypothetical protein
VPSENVRKSAENRRFPRYPGRAGSFFKTAALNHSATLPKPMISVTYHAASSSCIRHLLPFCYRLISSRAAVAQPRSSRPVSGADWKAAKDSALDAFKFDAS